MTLQEPPAQHHTQTDARTDIQHREVIHSELTERRVSFRVDGTLVFESSVSPNPPLGLVIWIDNQYAAFTPEGKIGFGVLENPEPAWLEVREIDLT